MTTDTINKAQFFENMEEAIEDMEPGSLTENTDFQSLPQWSSIAALMTIAMIFSEYSVQITGEELFRCKVVKDLIFLIEQKKK